MFLPGPPSLAVDPWKWRYKKLRADCVLVTHAHVDHCSEDDLVRAAAPDAVAIGPPEVAERLRAVFDPACVVTLSEGETYETGSCRIDALPHAGPERDGAPCGFHPRGQGISYLVTSPVGRYLMLGDSTALPEHEGLEPDVAFVAAGGLTVMNPAEAAQAMARIQPRFAVPVHWGDLHGRYDVARRFESLCISHGIAVRVQGEAAEDSAKT